MRLIVVFLMSLIMIAAPARAQTEGEKMMTKTALFAGGCFWCMESDFDHTDGVIDVKSGYAGGHVPNPTYEQVSTGRTGHKEVVQVTYDPAKVSYEKLLDIFWSNVDPFDEQGQFCDKGSQYVAGIFVADAAEKTAAEASKAAKEKHLGKPIATQILDIVPFYEAEEYHQEYYKKNELRYKLYRNGCGRDDKLKEIWGDDE